MQYIGSQWVIEDDGIITQKGNGGGYWIPPETLDHDWIAHMAEKNWVDLVDFGRALKVARTNAGIKLKDCERRRDTGREQLDIYEQGTTP